MMELLSRWLVQQPAHVLVVAAALLALWALGRAPVLRMQPGANVLLLPALLWLAYAAWEWLVLVKTPEANIRVDLLAIWPVLAILSAWALFRTIR